VDRLTKLGLPYKEKPNKLKEIINAKKIIRFSVFVKNKVRSFFDLIYKVNIKKNDSNIITLKISLNTTRYILFDRRNELKRITARKIDI
jgi:hypothetical protein